MGLGFASWMAMLSCAVASQQDLQTVAERCILEGLKQGGLVQGDVEEMVEKRIGALFMPHGVPLATVLCNDRPCQQMPLQLAAV
jgi:hypothetical protein